MILFVNLNIQTARPIIAQLYIGPGKVLAYIEGDMIPRKIPRVDIGAKQLVYMESPLGIVIYRIVL